MAVVVVHDQLFQRRRVAWTGSFEGLPSRTAGANGSSAKVVICNAVKAARAESIPIDAVQGRGQGSCGQWIGAEVWRGHDRRLVGGDLQLAVHLRLEGGHVLLCILAVSRRLDFAAVGH